MSYATSRRSLLTLVPAAAFVPLAVHATPSGSLGPAALIDDLTAAAATTGGVVGICAERLDGSKRVSINGQERFPMASCYKIAIAGRCLQLIDQGHLHFDDLIPVRPDQIVKSQVIGESLLYPGIALSLRNLFELMLTRSDNTASDVVMETVGGAAAVTAWVRSQGVRDLRVDRRTAEIIAQNPNTPGGERGPSPRYDDDPQDTCTPNAMNELLGKLFRGELLSAASTQILIDTMKRCISSPDRILGRLPPGSIVAHKPGSFGATLNDVGVVYLPHTTPILISIFSKKGTAPRQSRTQAIADIARSLRDYFLFG